MSINLNGGISSIYLGSSKIKDAYLGNIKVFSSSYSIPANALRIRFSDPSYSPNTSKGTWTKINGVPTNDWEWKYNNRDWTDGFGSQEQRKAIPSFQVVDAGDLSSVTTFNRFFDCCYNLVQDAGDILSIISSKKSGSPAFTRLFSNSGIANCSQWPSNLTNSECSKMFANCYNLENPSDIYENANSKGCTVTNIVAMSGLDKSSGRSSLINTPAAGGGSKSQQFTKGVWGYLTSSSLSWVNNPNSYRLATYIPHFPVYLTTASFTYTTKLANTNSTRLNRVYRSYFTGCFDYKGSTPSDTSKNLYALDAFFQVDDTKGITWARTGYNGNIIPSSYTWRDTLIYNYKWQPYKNYGIFDPTKVTYFSLVAVYSSDQSDTWNIPSKKFFLPCRTARNSASEILGAFAINYTLS